MNTKLKYVQTLFQHFRFSGLINCIIIYSIDIFYPFEKFSHSVPVGVECCLTHPASVLQIFLCDVVEVFRHWPKADVWPKQAQRGLRAAGGLPAVFGSASFIQSVPLLCQLRREQGSNYSLVTLGWRSYCMHWGLEEQSVAPGLTNPMFILILLGMNTCSVAAFLPLAAGSVGCSVCFSLANFFWENNRKAPNTD